MRNRHPSTIDLCVLIPCHNNLHGLIRSISSIAYHPGRYLVLVIDDGSTDAVDIEALYKHIPRAVAIHVIRLAQNMGITKALNSGLEYIYIHFTTRFIARLDCGDTCLPERFFRQVAFMEENPQIDLLGSWCYFKDAGSGEGYKYVTPTRHKLIKRSMNFRNVFIHPTVMWRVAAMETFKYPEQYPHAEDYGLFYDMVSKRKSAIIDDFLVTCEINSRGISLRYRTVQLKSRLKVISHYGKNKLLLFLGMVKLVTLMAVPYQLVFLMKKKAFRI